MNTIIKVENLGKKYTIRHEHPEGYVALRDVMAQKAKKIFSFPKNLRAAAAKPDYEDFWALKDLNFEINQGDRVGIIGRNGAGKSTLLKILSRITEPSTGRITMNGRVASLLEVGTGFHPELTGRENIFLNGAILGMSRAEIYKKFDEIVNFSGIEKFLDTPVKRYSSGMYVRLAFAVAAHLEPEILVVDEVLAVGDAEFQKKCLGKMEDVSRIDGRTILFVSHNLAAISKICKTGIFLNKGQNILKDEVNVVINSYNSYTSKNNDSKNIFTLSEKENLNSPKFKRIKLISDSIAYNEDLIFEVEIITSFDDNVSIDYEIRDINILPISYSSMDPMQGTSLKLKSMETNKYILKINEIKLASGKYSLRFWLTKPWNANYHIPDIDFVFEIKSADPYKSGFNYLHSYNRGVTNNLITLEKINI